MTVDQFASPAEKSSAKTASTVVIGSEATRALVFRAASVASTQ